jgi:hypothetical protein
LGIVALVLSVNCASALNEEMTLITDVTVRRITERKINDVSDT